MPKPTPDSSSTEPGAGKAGVSPGVATLLRGGNPGPDPRTQAVLLAQLQRWGKLRWLVRASLVLADLLLLITATDLAFTRSAAFGTGEVLLCTACVLAGAWLSCLAIWLE